MPKTRVYKKSTTKLQPKYITIPYFPYFPSPFRQQQTVYCPSISHTCPYTNPTSYPSHQFTSYAHSIAY